MDYFFHDIISEYNSSTSDLLSDGYSIQSTSSMSSDSSDSWSKSLLGVFKFLPFFKPCSMIKLCFMYTNLAARSLVNLFLRAVWTIPYVEKLRSVDADVGLHSSIATAIDDNLAELQIPFHHVIGLILVPSVRVFKLSQTNGFDHNSLLCIMAAVDSEYYFITIDVGAYGREGDSTTFKNF